MSNTSVRIPSYDFMSHHLQVGACTMCLSPWPLLFKTGHGLTDSDSYLLRWHMDPCTAPRSAWEKMSTFEQRFKVILHLFHFGLKDYELCKTEAIIQIAFDSIALGKTQLENGSHDAHRF